MSEVIPYEVSYSGRVIDELRNLAIRSGREGWGKEFLAAVREIEHRLRIYPQFGQPLQDLSVHPAQNWIGVVPPLVVKYVLDESRRQVIVSLPIYPLSGSGL